jgi:hypothetical protein
MRCYLYPLALCAALLSGTAAAQPRQPHSTVVFYPYNTPSGDPASEGQFKTLLRRRLQIAVEQWGRQVADIPGLTEADIAYVQQLGTYDSPRVTPSGLEKSAQLWRGDLAILLFYGALTKKSPYDYDIDSTAYFGPRSSPFNTQNAAVSTTLSNIRPVYTPEAHLVAILYALSKESARAGLSRKLTHFFAAEALEMVGNDPQQQQALSRLLRELKEIAGRFG